MSDRINIAKSVMSYEESPESPPYGKVIIHTPDGDLSWEDSTLSTYKTLEISTDFSNLAPNVEIFIISMISGYKYQAYSASGAITDPAIQLGDIVTINGTTSIAASIDMDLDSLCACDISAPDGGEVFYEYQYKDETQRNMSRVQSGLSQAQSDLTQKVSSGTKYAGVSIDGDNGFVAVCGNARLVIKSDIISLLISDQPVMYYLSTASKLVVNKNLISYTE